MSTETTLITTDPTTISKAIDGGRGAALSYLHGAHSAVYLQASREVSKRIADALGVDDPRLMSAIEALTPSIAASAGAALDNEFIVAGAKRAAFATGVIHGDAVLAPVRGLLADLFQPLEDAARQMADKGSDKGAEPEG